MGRVSQEIHRIIQKMYLIGLTGGFGTGKTTVAKIFKRLGAKVIDADKIAHGLLAINSPVYKKTVLKFGKGLLEKNKTLNRAKLAKVVFGDAGMLAAYLKIIHPQIKKVIERKITSFKKSPKCCIVVLDAPLLIEAGLDKGVDKIIVVETNKKNQFFRLADKSGFKKADVLRRIKFQLPLSEKIKMADYVIDNNAALKDTEAQVKQVWNSILKKAGN